MWRQNKKYLGGDTSFIVFSFYVAMWALVLKLFIFEQYRKGLGSHKTSDFQLFIFPAAREV